jgi:hypothetical protein
MNALGYVTIDKDKPYLTVYIKCTKLSGVTTSGPSSMSVTRLGEKAPCASYAPLQIGLNANTLLFALDSSVLSKSAGRYVGTITYKGTILGDVTFIYSKLTTVLAGENV